MTRPPSSPTSLYAPFFQADLGDLSGFRGVKKRPQIEKSLSLLATLRARLAGLPPEESAQVALESLFTTLIAAQVRAEYTAEQIQQLMWDAIRGLNFADDGLEDDLEGPLGNMETTQTSPSTLPTGEQE
ncbi:MAG: hypothetical protein HYZ25_18310 [Chloroflexi bacterium]|nr:hypothetical protein [Chloroflexota bacterium]